MWSRVEREEVERDTANLGEEEERCTVGNREGENFFLAFLSHPLLLLPPTVPSRFVLALSFFETRVGYDC